MVRGGLRRRRSARSGPCWRGPWSAWAAGIRPYRGLGWWWWRRSGGGWWACWSGFSRPAGWTTAAGQLGSPVSILGVGRLYLGPPLPVVGSASVALRHAASAAEVGRHRGVSGGEAGWRDGWRRRARAPVTGTGVCRSGCVRSPTSPFPRPRVGCGSSGDVQGGMYAAIRRSMVFLWCKVDPFGWSWGCLDVGWRPWRREAWRSGAEPASQVRAGSHGFAGDVAAGGWRSRGVSAGCEHRGLSLAQFMAVGGGVRGRRILLEGSVAVLPPPCVAPGENLIYGSDGGGYPWSYPSGRHRLGVLASSWPISPPRGLQVVLRSSF